MDCYTSLMAYNGCLALFPDMQAQGGLLKPGTTTKIRRYIKRAGASTASGADKKILRPARASPAMENSYHEFMALAMDNWESEGAATSCRKVMVVAPDRVTMVKQNAKGGGWQICSEMVWPSLTDAANTGMGRKMPATPQLALHHLPANDIAEWEMLVPDDDQFSLVDEESVNGDDHENENEEWVVVETILVGPAIKANTEAASGANKSWSDIARRLTPADANQLAHKPHKHAALKPAAVDKCVDDDKDTVATCTEKEDSCVIPTTLPNTPTVTCVATPPLSPMYCREDDPVEVQAAAKDRVERNRWMAGERMRPHEVKARDKRIAQKVASQERNLANGGGGSAAKSKKR